MINKNILTALMITCTLFMGTSCAHKSGHGNKNKTAGENKAQKQNTSTTSSSIVQRSNNNKDKLDGTTIFSKYSSAVFMIFTTDGTNNYQGSGFFINSNGLAVSNYHVFKGTNVGGEAIKLANSDVAYSVVDVLEKSEAEDFILFTVNCENTNYIPISNSKPRIGERVFAIGSPRGLENTFSSGEVSQWRDENLMQISALIDHGSSGGALINEFGEVVGITSGSFADGSQANLNYAWSIDAVKPYLKFE